MRITLLTKQPNLKLKTQLRQLSDYLPVAFALPALEDILTVLAMKEKSLFRLIPGPNVINLFPAVIYECSL
jgi:hypothetical protein